MMSTRRMTIVAVLAMLLAFAVVCPAAEEQPAAYKDVSLVVDVVHRAGLAAKVARLRPLGVVKR